MPAMKPFFLPKRPILPPGAAFWPETAVFHLETAPPFGAGAHPDAPGAEFQPAGAALTVPGAEFRRAGASLIVPGVEFCRPGASLDGAGAEFRRSGAAPISKTEAPAAWSDATISRSGHPAPHGCGTGPAGKSARAPLCFAQRGTKNNEPRTSPA